MNYPAASSGVSGIELPISLTPQAAGNSTLVGLNIIPLIRTSVRSYEDKDFLIKWKFLFADLLLVLPGTISRILLSLKRQVPPILLPGIIPSSVSL